MGLPPKLPLLLPLGPRVVPGEPPRKLRRRRKKKKRRRSLMTTWDSVSLTRMFWNFIECSLDETNAVNNMLAIFKLYAINFTTELKILPSILCFEQVLRVFSLS